MEIYLKRNNIEQKSNVLSCFLCADYVSVFLMILHHTQNNENLFATWQKTPGICFFLNVFTSFQTIANPSVFTVLPHPTQNIDNLFTIWHKIALIWTKVSCIILFSLRWLFIGFYRAPGAYLNWRGNISNLLKSCFFLIQGNLRRLVSLCFFENCSICIHLNATIRVCEKT